MPQTREDNLHVGAAGEADHALRQIDDLDGLAHVKDIDLTAFAHAAGFQHQLAGFGDGHEVADDFRVRDGYRAAGLDLFTEQRNDGAVGAQHVTEASGNELRRRQAFLLDLPCQRLHINLTDALGAAHHVRRVHSLVGRDHHKTLDLVLHGQIGKDLGADNVVLDGLGDIVLHHRHMLVCRGVEDVLGAVFVEDFLHPGLVGDVGDDGGGVDFGPFLLDFQADVVQRGFGRVNQDELEGIEHRNLPHDFTADGAGGARDEHPLPFQVGGNLLQVDLDGVAAQEVLDLDFLDGALLEGSLPIIGHLRRHEDLDALLQETVRQVGVLEHLRLGRRDNHRRHIVPVHLVQEILVVAVDIDTHHHLPDHIRIVRHKPHDSEAVILLRPEGLGNVDAGHRPIDISIQPCRTAVPVEIVIQHLDEHPGDRQQHERHDVGDNQYRDAGQMQPKYRRPNGGKNQ